jgi:flagella basal body P-ring formation protein FlgA
MRAHDQNLPMIRQLLTNCETALRGTPSLSLALSLSLSLSLSVLQPAHAQVTPDSLRQYVQREAASGLPAAAGGVRIDVTVGQLDQRLQLAPCARIEPFLPNGVRLWGRANVGLRCVEGATWSVLLPVTVRVFGPALVAARPLNPQVPLSQDDVQIAEVEWTREAQGVVTDAQQLANRVLQRPISVGQPIPVAALRAPTVISQGDPVRVIGNGRGFSISAEAIALASAQEGQAVRVRTDSGRVLSGTARAGRQVEVVF